MAIKMVREPSETPNINNIDDIIPMRYAYGGQNGYVIGKGTEISNTINGTNFIVNSGRLVIQGVECDIDATGVTIAVDNIATKRYYVVYLQVNLATNQVIIDSEYDTVDYPVIDSGDDLTENSSGIARMVLYKFTAQNGIISEVNKVVESIKYTENIYVNNAKTVNNIEFIFNNNKLKFNSDKIIEYKEVLWSGEQELVKGTIIPLNKTLNTGDIIRIVYKNDYPCGTRYLYKEINSGSIVHITDSYFSGSKISSVLFISAEIFGLENGSNQLKIEESPYRVSINIPQSENQNVTTGSSEYGDITIYEVDKIYDI